MIQNDQKVETQDNYQLTSSFKKTQQSVQIQIKLTLKFVDKFEFYETILDEQYFQHKIKENKDIFGDPEILYDCLKSKSYHEIDLNIPTLKVKSIIMAGTKKITKQHIIQLTKIQMTQNQMLRKMVKHLQKEVELLKANQKQKNKKSKGFQQMINEVYNKQSDAKEQEVAQKNIDELNAAGQNVNNNDDPNQKVQCSNQ